MIGCIEDSIVLIEDKSNGSFGTGFVIENNGKNTFILTCSHVLSSHPSEVTVDGEFAEVILNGENGIDMAIIAVKSTKTRTAIPLISMASKLIHNNAEICGYTSFDNNHKIKKTIIGHEFVRSDIINEQKIKTSGWVFKSKDDKIDPGYSGSPVIIDGKAIGIVSHSNHERNYAISIEMLSKLWSSYSNYLIKYYSDLTDASEIIESLPDLKSKKDILGFISGALSNNEIWKPAKVGADMLVIPRLSKMPDNIDSLVFEGELEYNDTITFGVEYIVDTKVKYDLMDLLDDNGARIAFDRSKTANPFDEYREVTVDEPYIISNPQSDSIRLKEVCPKCHGRGYSFEIKSQDGKKELISVECDKCHDGFVGRHSRYYRKIEKKSKAIDTITNQNSESLNTEISNYVGQPLWASTPSKIISIESPFQFKSQEQNESMAQHYKVIRNDLILKMHDTEFSVSDKDILNLDQIHWGNKCSIKINHESRNFDHFNFFVSYKRLYKISYTRVYEDQHGFFNKKSKLFNIRGDIFISDNGNLEIVRHTESLF
ncbi:S1 family peptidase [Fusibacter ferrireducens]|uniref:Trypsin-like peptidase domain-containing protein n=1 Tax=Fusibacter ferrireducens TaxID=2785058 RepID=A0ABR9ZNM3_9FIRM|nr:serine protease [Fusibacter ferrireducens]MBF4692062.1 trypsin-like peptidase domain-containing protein [Fusibacter ferrireducens]